MNYTLNSMKKRVPHRKCIGCGKVFEKQNLIRVVKDADGKCIKDEKMLMQGRGYYVCQDNKCLEKAGKRGVIF